MKLFRDICISDITVISGVRLRGRSTDRSEVGRENHGIVFIWNGEASFWGCDKRKIEVKAGELLFIPKYYKYKMQYTAPSTTFVLINFELFDKHGIEQSLAEDLEILTKDGQSNRIAAIMAKLELCGTSQDITAVLRRKELVYRLLGAICESDSSLYRNENKYPQIFEGVRLLEQTFLENIPVSRFAEASNISVSLFRSLFSRQYGMSPIQYRNRLRISRASVILAEGSCTVAEAAYASGFENVAYFCRYYKKITGMTPLQTKRGNSDL